MSDQQPTETSGQNRDFDRKANKIAKSIYKEISEYYSKGEDINKCYEIDRESGDINRFFESVSSHNLISDFSCETRERLINCIYKKVDQLFKYHST